MTMEDLLKGILGGAQQRPQGGQQPDPLAELLGGILGGAETRPARKASSGSADPLGAILGGQDGKLDIGDLARILGAALGTRQDAEATPRRSSAPSIPSNLGGNSFLAPIINELAQRLGLPAGLASTIVSFVLGQLLSRGASASATRSSSQRAPSQASEGLDLDYLLDTVGSGKQIQTSFLQSTGLPQQLAAQTGLDPKTATRSMQQVLELLGGQLLAARAPRAAASPTDLDHLLDDWPV